MANTLRSFQQIRVSQPPSFLSEDMRAWCREVTDALNATPPISVFSFANPNSNLTGFPGTLGLNITSQATNKIWIKQIGSGNTGWASVLTGTINEPLTVSGLVTALSGGTFNDNLRIAKATGSALILQSTGGLANDETQVIWQRDANIFWRMGMSLGGASANAWRLYQEAIGDVLVITTAGAISTPYKFTTSASTINIAEAPTGGGLTGNAAGTAGDIAWGASSGVSYLYVCTSTNSWMRAALSPF